MFEVCHLCPGRGKHSERQMVKGAFMPSFSERGEKKKLSSNPLNPRFSFMLCSALSGGFVFLSFHSDLLIIYLSADTSAQMPSAVC